MAGSHSSSVGDIGDIDREGGCGADLADVVEWSKILHRHSCLSTSRYLVVIGESIRFHISNIIPFCVSLSFRQLSCLYFLPFNKYPTATMETDTKNMDTKTSFSADSEEKQIGFSSPVDAGVIDSPAVLAPEHAAEYVEFVKLKQHFESNPTEYKRILRLRVYPIADSTNPS